MEQQDLLAAVVVKRNGLSAFDVWQDKRRMSLADFRLCLLYTSDAADE